MEPVTFLAGRSGNARVFLEGFLGFGMLQQIGPDIEYIQRIDIDKVAAFENAVERNNAAFNVLPEYGAA